VFAHPIRDLGVIGAVNHLLILANRMYADGPGSVSDSLYWLRDGVFERLAGEVQGEDVRFAPPDEFVEVLNGLAE
jgi:hypothetical protein